MSESAAGDTELVAEVLELLRLHEARAVASAPDGAERALPTAIGPYRVLARLGEGGMGAVYRAQRGDQPPVAIKVLVGGVLGDRMASRLAREAEALSRLDHPGIARFIEQGTHESSFGDQPYVVMQLIEGIPLQEWARRPEADTRVRLELIASLCDAIQHAHDRGVIHRDLKPTNILVDGDGGPHILDFGIARLTDSDLREATLLTRSGELLGTVRYMSPEQAQGMGELIDARTDVYSMGVIGYELLSGRTPYDLPTRSLTRALVMVATVEPTPVGRHHAKLRGEVESILERALQKRPEDRYPSAAALATDIRQHLDQRPVTAATGRAWRRTRAYVRRHRLAAPLIALLGTALLVAVVTVPWLRHRVTPIAWQDLRRMDDRLADADPVLHDDRVSAVTVDSLLGVYQGAMQELDTYPASDAILDLRRHVSWRTGEAWFLLGTRRRDPDVIARAVRWFAQSGMVHRPRNYDPPLPRSFRLASAIAGMTPEQASSGIALVEAELAQYRQPLFHLRRALSNRRSMLASYGADVGQKGRDPVRVRPLPPEEAYGLMLNEYGETLSAIAVLTDSLAPLERALQCFDRADSLERNTGDRIAYASLLFNRGTAYLRRAGMADRSVDLDSAESQLDAALTTRDEAGRPSRVDAHLALSRVFRSRAGRTRGPERRDALDRAQVHVDAALLALGEDRATPAAALPAGLERAALSLDRFEGLGDLAALDQAGRDLDRARPGLDPIRAPYPAAWFALEEARFLRARWQAAPAESLHTLAAAALERARDDMPRDQDQAFNRRITAEARLLRIPTPR